VLPRPQVTPPPMNKLFRTIAGFAFTLCLTGLLITDAQEAPTPIPSATPIPRPNPAATASDGRGLLELYFAALPQGGTGVARLTGPNVVSGRLRFLSTLTNFYAGDDGFYVIVPVGLDVTPRVYPLTVSVLFEDGTRGTLDAAVEVVGGGFLRQSFTIGGERAYLTAPEIERTEYGPH
jgi:hypothetical protein